MLLGDERNEYPSGEEGVFGAAHAEPRRVPALPTGSFEGGDGYTAPAGERSWQQEMPRWLATLNPGRTQHEYEKAVRYFFETPGVPVELSALSFDLLLAYRGSLALRATPHRDQPLAATRAPARRVALNDGLRNALPGETLGRDAGDHAAATSDAVLTPLSPATVNVRLTALRQFLTHCALFGWLPSLSPDRIKAALRRLSTERRRPYSVLAEPEWAQFLEAARLPAKSQSQRQSQLDEAVEADAAVKPTRQGPWGVPRALRKKAAEQAAAEAELSKPVEQVEDVPLVHSRAGLTGAHTA
ncbi:MAG TPA: hypothetical protein VGP82_15235, partial [Ktedonobacterales bacterium]|nr:hypothetical protein [Ktedonobacterales bacterium]